MYVSKRVRVVGGLCLFLLGFLALGSASAAVYPNVTVQSAGLTSASSSGADLSVTYGLNDAAVLGPAERFVTSHYALDGAAVGQLAGYLVGAACPECEALKTALQVGGFTFGAVAQATNGFNTVPLSHPAEATGTWVYPGTSPLQTGTFDSLVLSTEYGTGFAGTTITNIQYLGGSYPANVSFDFDDGNGPTYWSGPIYIEPCTASVCGTGVTGGSTPAITTAAGAGGSILKDGALLSAFNKALQAQQNVVKGLSAVDTAMGNLQTALNNNASSGAALPASVRTSSGSASGSGEPSSYLGSSSGADYSWPGGPTAAAPVWDVQTLSNITPDTRFQASSTPACPAGPSFSFYGSTYTVSFKPICDAAAKIEPIVTGAGYLSAAMIVAGGL